MKPMPSARSVLVAGLWRATLLTSTWGQPDDTSYLEASALNNERRTYNGTGNNIAQPEWGSVGQKQLRSVTVANYADGVSTPPGEARPTPRELLSDVFLATPSSSSATSALFVGWGLLVGYDIFLNADNAWEPLDIACDDASLADVWCPLGSLSEPISFNRSQGEIDAEGDRARSPTNYATAYVDLDWLYGRDEGSAAALRTLDAGYLNLTADELPHLLSDGTWLVADQRPMRMPVTFALTTLLLREHNRCCDERAGAWGADTDEDVYQVCRQWTIAVFQHITEHDFAVRLVGGSVKTLGAASYSVFYGDDSDTASTRRQRRLRRQRQRQRRLLIPENAVQSRYLAQTNGTYDLETNGGADAVFSTVAIPAFYSALPSTVGLLDDNYDVVNEHGVELATASADVAGLIERIGGIEAILRGGAYSRTQAMDVSFVAEVSVSSPLFNLPVVTIQRGRDHGIPSYNGVREAYGLSRVTTFEDITSDGTVQGLLEDAYGDVELLDAYTGALAEREDGSGLLVGPLLRAVFLEQLYRAIVGDRHHHSHDTQNEDAELSTLWGLIVNNSLVSSMSLDAFTAPDTVASSTCSSTEVTEVYLAEGYKLAWNETTDTDSEPMYITISARGIETQGMIAIGFGGEGMTDTNDFVICVVSSESTANCTDHSGPESRKMPPHDVEGVAELEVVNVTSIGEWTSVTFVRWGSGDDDSDYPLADDIAAGDDTPIIYSWRSGEGIGKHPNSQRGIALVNFADATATSSSCDDSTDYYALHGALLLFVWMLIAPYGIYQARYRKGQKSIIGNLWWEMHEECMVICAEAVLPLAITAIFTTGGPHNSRHAKWGFYMIGAVVLQIGTGWARTRALLAKGSNFSVFHRVNKQVHIYAGWFAYMAGLVQCYRGLELISGADKLVFSAVDIDFRMGNFEIVRKKLFPIWLATVPLVFIALETRKQFRRYFTKGSVSLCGMVEIINDTYSDEALKKEVEDRLMPRTEELPLYSMHEFNNKILNGRTWVIVDAAVLDVSSFAKRHPGGARLILNAMGTDVTSEIIAEDASIGNAGMAFAPHRHSDTALEIARSLVVGYIEEEDDMDTDTDGSAEGEDGDGVSSGTDLEYSGRQNRLRARRLPSLSGSDGESGERRGLAHASHRNPHASRVPPRGEQSIRPGRLALWSDGEVESMRRASLEEGRRAVYPKSGNSRGGGESGSGSDSDNITERRASLVADGIIHGQQKRQSDVSGGKKKTAPESVVAVGAAMTLSVEAAAIVNARSPVPPPPQQQLLPPVRGYKGAAVGADFGVLPAVEEDTSPFEPALATPALSTSRRLQERLSLVNSKSFNRPVEFEHPVERNTTVPSRNQTAMTEKGPPTINSIRRILRRIGTRIDTMEGAGVDENAATQEDKPFKATRRVRKKKNPQDFFHVCPLLMHTKMGGGAGRPVYKFVFACPGRAGALVSAMVGVCHFHMRVAQEAGMTMVQRSYNAFAVRVQGGGGNKRQVVPAGETSEGELCIEMRIRIYPDGSMSKLLLQLLKNSDNPAVQLKGPFLQDRLIPPPVHRNVVMIAAGTGVNPMVQLIRDYLHPDSHTHRVLLGAHSRLVLLWQNTVEGDLFCTEELTMMQAKAKGLLEVTALISGDITRRNVPGNAFRRAKQRLTKKGRKAGLVSRGVDDTGDTKIDGGGTRGRTSGRATSSGAGGGREFKQEDQDNIDGEVVRGVDMLSRVTEEEYRSRESSISGFGGRDVGTGGGGGDIFGSPKTFRKGVGERKVADEADDGGTSNVVSGSPNRGDGAEGVAGGRGRHPELSSGGMEERGGSHRGEEALPNTDGSEDAREPSVAASSAGGLTVMEEEKGDCGRSGGGDSCATLRGHNDGELNRNRSSSTFNREEAIGHLNGESSDESTSSRVPKDGRADGGSGGEGVTNDGTSLVDARREASLGRDHRPKSNRMENDSGRTGESSGSSGGVEKAQVAKSPSRPPLGRLKSPKIDAVTASLGEEIQVDVAIAASDGVRPSRPQRPTASTLPPAPSLSTPPPSTRHRPGVSDNPPVRPGVNAYSQPTARRKRRGWSRRRSSVLDKASEDLAMYPLDESGTGLQYAKLSRTILQEAIGPDVMAAVVSSKASIVAGASQEGSTDAADGSRSALSDLVGTDTTGGTLQVVVSGPAGFVFHAEGLLAELGIPPQAVVLLD